MEINRLLWASRRGMLELDLILLPFVENVYPTLNEKQQSQFDTLLDSEDQDLYRWFLGKDIPDDENLQSIVCIVRQHTGMRGKTKESFSVSSDSPK